MPPEVAGSAAFTTVNKDMWMFLATHGDVFIYFSALSAFITQLRTHSLDLGVFSPFWAKRNQFH